MKEQTGPGDPEPLRPALKIEGVPISLARSLRAVAPRTVQRITIQIQLEVTAYAGPHDGRRHQLVFVVVDKVVNYFLDAMEHKTVADATVYELIRHLGQVEAAEGNTVDALRAAHYVATRVARRDLRKLTAASDLDPIILSALFDGLYIYTDQLINQASLGHSTASKALEGSTHHARRELLAAMLSGQPRERYATYLKAANWQPPDHISVATGVLNRQFDYSHLPKFAPDVLSGIHRHRMTLITRPEQVHSLSQQLLGTPGVTSVATSWVMPVEEIHDAYRWTYRTLDLASRGLINQTGVIDCAQHRLILWLHADPPLSRLACEELLAPLLDQTDHQRLVLAETLLLWLQARESAPALGERMNVHEHTVRRRLHRLREIFGDQLVDPQQTLALLSSLEVTLPLWQEEGTTAPNKKRQR